jgi:hypothetical protein
MRGPDPPQLNTATQRLVGSLDAPSSYYQNRSSGFAFAGNGTTLRNSKRNCGSCIARSCARAPALSRVLNNRQTTVASGISGLVCDSIINLEALQPSIVLTFLTDFGILNFNVQMIAVTTANCSAVWPPLSMVLRHWRRLW